MRTAALVALAVWGWRLAAAVRWGCPTREWTLRGGTCYLVDGGPPRSWHDGRKLCQDRGGDLILPRSREENDFVRRALLPGYVEGDKSTNAWLGVLHGDRDRLEFDNGIKWEFFSETECGTIALSDGGTWRGISCGNRKRTMCQTPARRAACTLTCAAIPRDRPRCLTDHALAEFRFETPAQCCIACSRAPACRSFNLRGDMCQLNNVTASQVGEGFSRFIHGCAYYEYE